MKSATILILKKEIIKTVVVLIAMYEAEIWWSDEQVRSIDNVVVPLWYWAKEVLGSAMA